MLRGRLSGDLHVETVDILNEQLNRVDSSYSIRFTNEVMVNQQIQFLDTNNIKSTYRIIKNTVFRKSTHMNQYMQFTSWV